LGRKFKNGAKRNIPGKKKNIKKYMKPRSKEVATYQRLFR
jgi:hypothetical protein